MKTALLILCTSFALVGCTSSKGGLSDQAGYSDDDNLNRRPLPTRMLETPLRGNNGSDRR